MTVGAVTQQASHAQVYAAPAPVPTIGASLYAAPLQADAELIRLCDAYIQALAIANTGGSMRDDEASPAWQAVEAIERQLEGITATTLAGIAAKARVARDQATMPDGSVNYSDSYTGRWPEEVVRDLLRLVEARNGCEDEPLLAAFSSYSALRAEEIRLEGFPEPTFGTPEAKAREAAFENLADQQATAVETVIASPARTIAGLQAKAQIVAQTLPNAVQAFELELDSEVIRLTLSLANDLCGSAA